jgi:hypothetical protein
MNKDPHNPRGLSGKSKVKIFVVYFVMFGMVATLACFTVQILMQPAGIASLAVASIVLPAIATFLHVRKGSKDGVDDIARRLP